MLLIVIIFIGVAFGMLSYHETLDYPVIVYVTMAMNFFTLFFYLRKYRKTSLVCFEFLFSLAFFGATYSYFLVQNVSSSYALSLMEMNINKKSSFGEAVIISSIAYYFFILGSYIANFHSAKKRNSNYNYSKETEIVVSILYIIIFIVFLSRNFYSYLYSKSQVTEVTSTGAIRGLIFWVNTLMILYSLVVFMNNRVLGTTMIKDFLMSNKLYSVLWMVLVLLHLISGHRHHALTIIAVVIFLYTVCIKKIPNLLIISGLVAGTLLFSLIGYLRTGLTTIAEYELQVNGLVRDFVPASLATPFFIEYTDNYGYTYGANYFLPIVGIVPFLAGILKMIGLYVTAPTSYDFFTLYVTEDSVSGLGTSLVGDIYYSWGFVGVLICFCFLGYFVSWLYKRIVVYNSTSPYLMIAYIVMMSVSIFLPRTDFVSYFRTIALLCIFYYLIQIFFSKYKR